MFQQMPSHMHRVAEIVALEQPLESLGVVRMQPLSQPFYVGGRQ